jgi:hypothetical protein
MKQEEVPSKELLIHGGSSDQLLTDALHDWCITPKRSLHLT